MPSPPKAKPVKQGNEDESSPSNARRSKSSGRISAACEACKRRKTKCTGGPSPCVLCESLGTECVIDLSLDMRRRAALQRTIDESKSYQDALCGLVDYMKDSASQNFESLLEFLRSNPSPQEIALAMQQNLGITQLHNTGSQPSEDGTMISPVQDSFAGTKLQPESTSTQNSSEMVDPEILHVDTSLTARSGKEAEGRGQFSQLILKLKASSDVDAEAMLLQLLADRDSEVGNQDGDVGDWPSLNSLSAVSSVNESSLTYFSPPTVGERSSWHPALQAQSVSGTSSGREQRSQNNRRYSDASSISAITSPMDSRLPILSTLYPEYLTNQSPSLMQPNSYMAYMQSTGRLYETQSSLNDQECSLRNQGDLCVAREDRIGQLRIPIHLVQPLIVPDESFLSKVYSDYVQGAKQMISNRIEFSEVLGNGQDVVVDLFFRERRQSDRFDCSSWASELSRSFTEMDQFVRLANAALLTYMMRWLLVPSRENYGRLPDMMKPTPVQRMIPHIGAIEICVIPAVRDATIQRLRDWLTPLAQSNCSVNWPFSMNGALDLDPHTGSTRLSARFIAHACHFENWSVGASFLHDACAKDA